MRPRIQFGGEARADLRRHCGSHVVGRIGEKMVLFKLRRLLAPGGSFPRANVRPLAPPWFLLPHGPYFLLMRQLGAQELTARGAREPVGFLIARIITAVEVGATLVEESLQEPLA